MCGSGALLVRRAVADVAVENDKRGPVLRPPEELERMLDAMDVVCVAHTQDVPPISQETRRDVLRERELGIPLDGDVVVVEDPAEIVETQVPGQRGSLRGNTLHQAAIAADGVDLVIEDLEAWPVVAIGEPLFGSGHSHARGYSLPERARSSLHAGDPAVLGMPGRSAVELAEVADVIERHRRLSEPLVFPVHGTRTSEMQNGPEQHGCVAVGEHEAVAIGPDGVLRIELHHTIRKRVDERRERHGSAGMSGFGLLHGINRQSADGIDRELSNLSVGCQFSYEWSTHGCLLASPG